MKKKLLLVLLTIALVFCAIGAGAIVASAETTAPEMRIAFCNLSFRDTVCIKYAVKTDVSNVKILLWTSPRAEYTVGTQDSEITKSYNEVISGVTHKVFDYTALSAKQMTDVIYARAYAQVDGVDCYSDVTKYSVLQYAYNKLGKTATASSDADLKELLSNMLSYGASAQKYFDYKEDRLATANWYQVKLTEGLLDDGCTFGLYLPGDTVTLTAPEKAENGDIFSHWADQSGNQIATTAAYELTVGTANKVYTPAYAHIPAVDAAVAPTCVETGLTEGSHCAACGEVLVAQEVVAATGVHTFGEWVTVKEPTKKEEGLAERTCYCGEKETQAVEKIQPVLSYALNDDGQSYTVTGVGEWTAAEFGRDLAIPATYNGLPVTRIGSYAFRGNESLYTVNIPDSVTCIEDAAFINCYSLGRVYIGSGVTSVDGSAFMGCICLGPIEVSPDNATYYSFGGCLITKATNVLVVGVGSGDDVIPEGITLIADFAFYSRYGTISVTIPDSVTCIGVSAFAGCEYLEEITYGGTIAQWGAVTKGSDWNYNTGEFVVICTDGTACKNHNVVIDAAVAPTCAATGLTEGSHCSGCGKVIVAQNTVAALGHQVAVTTVTEKTETFYTVSNSSTYPFAVSGNQITSTNKASSSSATYTITAKKAFTLALEYKVSSEANYDKLTINHNSTTKVTASGTTATTFTSLNIAMSAGDTVTITYSKDSSLDRGDDCAWVNLLTAKTQTTTTEKTEYVTVTESNRESLGSYTEDVICAVCGGVAIEKIVPVLDYTLNSDGQSYAVTGIGKWTGSELIIPDTYNGLPVTKIGAKAFYLCNNLTSVTVPDSVTNIGAGAFSGCASLVSIDLPFVGANANYSASKETLFGYIFGDSSYEGGKETEQYHRYSENDYSYSFYIPQKLRTVTIRGGYIRYGAFGNCTNITKIVLGDKVKYIDDENAFRNCKSLTYIEIGNSVTSIGDEAFYGCTALKSIVIPRSVKTIGYGAFDNVSLLQLNAVFYTGTQSEWNAITFDDFNRAFDKAQIYYYSELKPTDTTNSYWHYVDGMPVSWGAIGPEISYSDGLVFTSNGDGTCYVTGDVPFEKTSVIIPSSSPDGWTVTSVGAYAFYCAENIVSVTIPSTVTSIGKSAFYDCNSLVSVSLPASLTSISEQAFNSCGNLASITIPSKVTSIGYRAFGGCVSLTTVTIPSSVTSIGGYAFYACRDLTSIVFADTTTWYRTTSITDWNNMTGGTSTSVTSSTTNATYFKSTYYDYYWYKK